MMHDARRFQTDWLIDDRLTPTNRQSPNGCFWRVSADSPAFTKDRYPPVVDV
jgi:hypothetical protein